MQGGDTRKDRTSNSVFELRFNRNGGEEGTMYRQSETVVGVIAGTPVDSAMGVQVMRQAGLKAAGEFISEDPIGNSAMQALRGAELQKLIVGKIELLRKKFGVRAICIYCNSISAVLDLTELRRQVGIPVVTPLECYLEVGQKFDTIAVLAANGQAVASIERIILSVNKKARVLGLGVLPLVTAIEKGETPADIILELGIGELARFFRAAGAQVLVLGCTHFSYIRPQLAEITDIPVFDPSEAIVARMREVLS